jgi:hypothetical protein
MSDDSSSINSFNGKPDFAPTRAPIPSPVLAGWKQKQGETVPPAFARYGAGGVGRQQVPMTLMTPQKLWGPPSPTGPTSFSKSYKPLPPGEDFHRLPEEILLVVLGELKKLHLDAGSLSCSTCWMRDLMNLGLSCRKWWGAARKALYEDIQLIGNDSIIHTKKRWKIKHGTRLKLLRRTLRSRPDLAQYVKSLKVPAMPDAAKTKQEQAEYLDLVASVIMACPRLERLPGFYPVYNHEFSRFVHALSSRRKMTEVVWVINPSPFQRQHRYNLSEDSEYLTPVLAPAPLLPEQCIDLLTYHSNWSSLQTLVLHCNEGGTIDSLLFTDIFKSLPSLENLHVSSFPAPSFNDKTLLSLPPLKSLRLENLSGLTSEGLSAFSAPRRADTLKSLALISIPLLSLPVLARMFSHLKSLTRFTISQAPSPSLPIGTEIFLHPYLASSTVEYLHWEFTNPDDDKATAILAKAIRFGGFPSLKTLRAPTDFDGALQALCKPRERIELPGDRYRNLGMPGHIGIPSSQSMSNMASPTPSTFSLGGGPNMPFPTRSPFSLGPARPDSVMSNFKSPTRSSFSLPLSQQSSQSDEINTREKGMSLATARRMAQQRIEVATTQPQFHIIVWHDNGEFAERYAVGAFIGLVSSKVNYSLKPDVDGMDEAIVGVDGAGGLLDGGDEIHVKDGCTGSWHLDAGKSAKNGGKGKDGWWHTERGRWRELSLEKLF